MAEKNTGKKKTSVASRANGFIDQCFDLGGEPTVDAVKPGGTTVTCAVSGGGSQTCTFTKKSTRCHENAEGPPLGTTPGWSAEVPDGDIQPNGERKRRRR